MTKKVKKIIDPRIDETLKVLEDILLENNVNDAVLKATSDFRDKLISNNVKVDRLSVKHFLTGKKKAKLMKELLGLISFHKFNIQTHYLSRTTTIKNNIGFVILKHADAAQINYYSSKFILKTNFAIDLNKNSFCPYNIYLK